MGMFDGLGLHPILSMGAECALFSFIGSFLCQLIFGKKGESWDVSNMIVMMSYSAFVFAPTAFYWYPFLEELFPGNENSLHFVYKLGMDQLLYSPLILCAFWFHSTFFSTFDLNKSISAISANIISSLISNWCYWPFVQAINIGYVPDQYKVSVLNIASIPWNIYISYSVSQSKGTEKSDEQTSKPASTTTTRRKKKKPKKEL